MLSVTDNEKLARTGPGTPMGELFRRFWIPAILSSELPEVDGPPVKVGLLSEKLVAFRDSSGRVGLLESRCPHRHANLYWGRNEDGGLRCVYHGWKFAADGTCLDQPAEPEGSHFKDHVCAVAYLTHEAGGIIWAYLGPEEKAPPFPAFDWTFLDPDHYVAHKRLQQCNYLQNLEGELDTAHVNFLHRSWAPGEPVMPPASLSRKRYLVAETDFGLLCMARSNAGDGQYYWRITPFHLPSYTMPPVGANAWLGAVPIDDDNMWGFAVSFDPDRPLTPGRGGSAHSMKVDPKTFLPEANISNDYMRDLGRQRNGSWTGMKLIKEQDMAVQEDQDGPRMRRQEEHLGVTDGAIVAARRLLIRLADDLALGIEPPQARHPDAYRLRSLAVTAPGEADPVELWLGAQPAPLASTASRTD